MKKLKEINVLGEDSFSCIVLHVYQLVGDEYWNIDSMNHCERCELMGVEDQSGHDVLPGETFHSYQFIVKPEYLIMEETLACNV